MGNHRFRVSDMMPSSWFFKLKDASRYTAMKRSHHYHHHHHPPQSTPLPLPRRSSFYISTRERTEGFPHSPVNHKASDTQFPLVSPRKLNATNNPTAKPASSSSRASAKCSSATDSIRKFEELEELSELNLPPILTKPMKEELTRSGRRSPSSPRFGARSLHACRTTRKSRALSESLVVVKSSVDPQKDFRESMVEMIIENNIRTAKDLEELLMCYLSLNSRRYHGIILREFKQIWFEFLTH